MKGLGKKPVIPYLAIRGSGREDDWESMVEQVMSMTLSEGELREINCIN